MHYRALFADLLGEDVPDPLERFRPRLTQPLRRDPMYHHDERTDEHPEAVRSEPVPVPPPSDEASQVDESQVDGDRIPHQVDAEHAADNRPFDAEVNDRDGDGVPDAYDRDDDGVATTPTPSVTVTSPTGTTATVS